LLLQSGENVVLVHFIAGKNLAKENERSGVAPVSHIFVPRLSIGRKEWGSFTGTRGNSARNGNFGTRRATWMECPESIAISRRANCVN
jgi:hypothetical protein